MGSKGALTALSVVTAASTVEEYGAQHTLEMAASRSKVKIGVLERRVHNDGETGGVEFDITLTLNHQTTSSQLQR